MMSRSPPMRGRGLKLCERPVGGAADGSPPMRGRGLKLSLHSLPVLVVVSPPMRGRGLKQGGLKVGDWHILVAPHAGARIETGKERTGYPTQKPSPPMRGRGLKHNNHPNRRPPPCRSPPMRGRGLKHQGARQGVQPHRVAPHAGARIETCRAAGRFGWPPVAPHAGARIETFDHWGGRQRLHVAPHAGARIETGRPPVNGNLKLHTTWSAPLGVDSFRRRF